MIRRLFLLLTLGTAALTYMDWIPIHDAWWHYGRWPAWALGNFTNWSALRTHLGTLVCPPCAAMAENYYFVLMEIEASELEQGDVLTKHSPYSGNPLAPDGLRFWWGQGPNEPWRPVSMLAWYLYWLPKTVLWWWLHANDILHGRWPWWFRQLGRLRRR